jgi:hypothetical protein
LARGTPTQIFVFLAVAFACASRESKPDAASLEAGGAPDSGADSGGASGTGPLGGSGPTGGGGTASGVGASSSMGGANAGGADMGGSMATGGAGDAGGAATGGAAGKGGAATGGTAGKGGAATGGTAGKGGAATGGAAGKGGSGGTPAALYSTDFGLTESPISDGGAWRQAGLDWTRVITANGFAFGTQSGTRGFDDSYAYLTRTFPANQSATAVIHLEAGITSLYAEVEILLRWRDGAHDSTGYECNLAFNGQYAEIIKWPGPLGTQSSQFTFISRGNPVAAGVHDGDVFQADVIGNVITSRLNGRVLATGTDTSLPSGGAPGIGFYCEGAPCSQKYSFTQFSATGL